MKERLFPPRPPSPIKTEKPPFLSRKKKGVGVNADKLCCLLFIALKNGSDSIAVPLDEKEAEVRLSELMQDTHERGSFSTVFAGGEARRHNIALAAKSVCGVSVAPGEVFSFNRTVGRRTTERGYKNAPVIYKGEYTEGVGGGVCQVSTTLYNAVLLGDLPVRERNRHTLRSRYVEPGFDAMVTDAGADLRFVNNTPGYIYIYASVRENVLTVKIYGRENIYEIERESRIIEEYKTAAFFRKAALYTASEASLSKRCVCTGTTIIPNRNRPLFSGRIRLFDVLVFAVFLILYLIEVTHGLLGKGKYHGAYKHYEHIGNGGYALIYE